MKSNKRIELLPKQNKSKRKLAFVKSSSAAKLKVRKVHQRGNKERFSREKKRFEKHLIAGVKSTINVYDHSGQVNLR